MNEPLPRGRLPNTVLGLGFVSLFTNLSSEAIFPLLPVFLTTLGATGAFIGVVEGTAELVASLLKYVSGRFADRRARLKPLVLAGYGLSTVVRPLVAFALVPWHVLLVRVVDRVGKGVRTSPRDALIAAATPPAIRARAYGFNRAMDHGGAALGTLLGAGLLWLYGGRPESMRQVFAWAAIPGFVALLALALTPETPRPPPARTAAAPPQPPPPGLRRAIVAMVLFALANATDAFLLVAAVKLGAHPAFAPLLWLVLHVVKSATATTGGRLADRYGRRNALAVGWTVYALTWGAAGFAGSLPVLFALTAVYALSHGLVEGAEKALVAELAGAQTRGRAFGAYNMAIGVAALVSSVGFGAAWDRYGGRVAFVGSATCALLAAAVLLALVPRASSLPARVQD